MCATSICALAAIARQGCAVQSQIAVCLTSSMLCALSHVNVPAASCLSLGFGSKLHVPGHKACKSFHAIGAQYAQGLWARTVAKHWLSSAEMSGNMSLLSVTTHQHSQAPALRHTGTCYTSSTWPA
jgi:hypothetical protein